MWDGSRAMWAQLNRPPPRSPHRHAANIGRANESARLAADLSSNVGTERCLAPWRTKVRRAATDPCRFEFMPRRSPTRGTTLEGRTSLLTQRACLRPSAHVNRLARNEAGLVAAQEGDHARDVLRLADAAQRYLRGCAQLEGLVVHSHAFGGGAGHARPHEPWSHRVDADV